LVSGAERRKALAALLGAGLGILVATPRAGGAAGADARAPVELRCKIVRSRADRGYKLWKLELKRSSGEPVRQAVGAAGDTVPFRNLEPAIYILCIGGDKGRSRCESIDLVPPPEERAPRFAKNVETPLASLNDDAHRIAAARLAVPTSARREMVRAEEAQLRGDNQAALRHLERAIEIYPRYADALNNVGTHYHRKGDYGRSIEYFSRVTRIDPKFFPGWVNLGGSLLALGKLQDAREANLKAAELRPNDPLANTQLGINYFYLRQYGDAKTYFLKVVDLDPASANSPQLFLAHIAMAERSPREAEGYIRSYLELHPYSPRAPNLRRTLENLASGGLVNPRELANPQR
jgi:tetratricopeptide (TPR) repeat protein